MKVFDVSKNKRKTGSRLSAINSTLLISQTFFWGSYVNSNKSNNFFSETNLNLMKELLQKLNEVSFPHSPYFSMGLTLISMIGCGVVFRLLVLSDWSLYAFYFIFFGTLIIGSALTAFLYFRVSSHRNKTIEDFTAKHKQVVEVVLSSQAWSSYGTNCFCFL